MTIWIFNVNVRVCVCLFVCLFVCIFVFACMFVCMWQQKKEYQTRRNIEEICATLRKHVRFASVLRLGKPGIILGDSFKFSAWINLSSVKVLAIVQSKQAHSDRISDHVLDNDDDEDEDEDDEDVHADRTDRKCFWAKMAESLNLRWAHRRTHAHVQWPNGYMCSTCVCFCLFVCFLFGWRWQLICEKTKQSLWKQ